MASQQLETRSIDCDFGHSKVEGNRIYYDCGPNGRRCMHGRRHDHNRAYVEFTRAGDMEFNCYSSQCPVALKLGKWVSDDRQLLMPMFGDQPAKSTPVC